MEGPQNPAHRPNVALCLLLQIKFYWNSATPIQMSIAYSCSHDAKAEWNSSHEDCWTYKVKNVYSLTL